MLVLKTNIALLSKIIYKFLINTYIIVIHYFLLLDKRKPRLLTLILYLLKKEKI